MRLRMDGDRLYRTETIQRALLLALLLVAGVLLVSISLLSLVWSGEVGRWLFGILVGAVVLAALGKANRMRGSVE